MKKTILAFILLSPCFAQYKAVDLTGTNISGVCPADNGTAAGPAAPYANYPFHQFCTSNRYIYSWSSAIIDTACHRLVLKGGGHSDYHGNDLYAIYYNTPGIYRIYDPDTWCNNGFGGNTDHTYCGSVSPSTALGIGNDTLAGCNALTSNKYYCFENSNNTPVAAHAFGSWVYLPTQNAGYQFGNSTPNGNVNNMTWLANFDGTCSTSVGHVTWVGKDPVPDAGVTCSTGVYCDPLTISPSPSQNMNVYISTDDTVVDAPICASNFLFKYYPATNRYKMLNSGFGSIFAQTGDYDPVNDTIYYMGSDCAGSALKVGKVPLSGTGMNTYIDITSSTTGCSALDVTWPGFSWDSYSNTFKAYPGNGNTFYSFDPTTLVCTSHLMSGYSIPTKIDYGVFGKFRYTPDNPGSAVYYGAGVAANDAVLMTVDPVSPTITSSATLAAGTQLTAYTFTVTATGTTPITYSITSGALPVALSINTTTGVIAGTPTGYGTFNFDITASNGIAPANVQHATLVIDSICLITAATLPSGKFNQAYSQTVTTDGCSGAQTFAVTSGSLPTSLSLNGSTGVISGTPTTPGAFPFTVTVTDSKGNPFQAYSVTIIPGPGFMNDVMTSPQVPVR